MPTTSIDGLDRSSESRAEIWRPREVWLGATAVIIASGPSLTLRQMSRVYVERCRRETAADFKVAVVNDSVLAAPWADLLYAGDMRWWDYAMASYPNVLQRFRGEFMVTQDRRVAERWSAVRCLEPTTSEVDGSRLGFDPRPGCLRNGPNSGYQALHLAVQLGARRVILLGFDCRDSNTVNDNAAPPDRVGHHWHRDRVHPHGRRMDYGAEQYGYWREGFASLVQPLAERGVEVVNCSPATALEVWRRGELDVEIEKDASAHDAR